MKRKKANFGSEVSIEALQKAVLDLHGCKATWIKSVPVKKTSEGDTVWEGFVQVFVLATTLNLSSVMRDLMGLDNSKKNRFFAVLHQGPIDLPQAAIRASIVQGFRKTLNKAKGG